jgi:hypothetical protein
MRKSSIKRSENATKHIRIHRNTQNVGVQMQLFVYDDLTAEYQDIEPAVLKCIDEVKLVKSPWT